MKFIIAFLALYLIVLSPRALAQGCAEPSSDEGVTVWGYLQPEFATHFEDETRASFQFRRMRLGVMGNIPYDFSYYVLLETSQFLNPENNSPFLLDAFISYNRFDYARIAVGSFKFPFGAELTQPCHGLYTIRRSKIVDQMTVNYSANSNRDIGIQFLGGRPDSFFSYQLALTNGYGVLFGDRQNNLLDSWVVTGRAVVQPLTGLRIGASFRTGELPAQSEGVTTPDSRVRWGADVSYKTETIFVQAEYIDGTDEGSFTTGGGCDGGAGETIVGTNYTDGLYVMGAYRFPFNLEPVYKFETYNTSKTENTDNPSTTDFTSMCQTFGLNYYPNDWTRIQLNYIYSTEDPVEEMNDALIVQIQVKF